MYYFYYNFFMSVICAVTLVKKVMVIFQSEDRQKAGIAWARIRAAMDVLSVSPEEQSAIWSVLAAIYHLGTAGVARGKCHGYVMRVTLRIMLGHTIFIFVIRG